MTITVSLSKPEVKYGALSFLSPEVWTAQYWLKFTIAGSGEAQSPAHLVALAATTVEEAKDRASFYQQGIQNYIKDLDLPEAITAFKGLIEDIQKSEWDKLNPPPYVDNS